MMFVTTRYEQITLEVSRQITQIVLVKLFKGLEEIKPLNNHQMTIKAGTNLNKFGMPWQVQA